MLQEALRAQSYEDDGEVELSLELYYKSACQLNYFADCHGGTDMGQLCQGLSQLFQQRMLVSLGHCNMDVQLLPEHLRPQVWQYWQQQEQHTALPQSCRTTCQVTLCKTNCSRSMSHAVVLYFLLPGRFCVEDRKAEAPTGSSLSRLPRFREHMAPVS